MRGIKQVTLSSPEDGPRDAPKNSRGGVCKSAAECMYSLSYAELQNQQREKTAVRAHQFPGKSAQPSTVPGWANQNGARIVGRKYENASVPKHATAFLQALLPFLIGKQVINGVE